MFDNIDKKKILKILLVEDNEINIAVMKKMLSCCNNFAPSIVTATCLSEARKHLHAEEFDVILLDLGLPDSDYENTFLTIQKKATNAAIVVISAMDEEKLQSILSKSQATNYLTKSKFSKHTLEWTILFSLKQKAAQVELQKRGAGAEQKAKESEERFRIIFEKSPLAITVTDNQERIISWNKFTEQLLGMSRDDLYLKPISSLYSEEEWKRIRSLNIRKEGFHQNLTTFILKKDGSSLDVDISISVLKDADGNVTGSIGIIRDISERKKAERIFKEKVRRSNIILDLMQNLTPDILPSDMLKLIINISKSLIKADTASIVLLDESQMELTKIVNAESTDERAGSDYLLNPTLDADTSITGWVIANKEPLLLYGKAEDDERFKNIKWKGGIKCSINAPIIYKDSVKGTLNLNITTSDYKFNEADLEAIIGLANHIAVALENSGLYRSMKDKYIDDLTDSNESLKTLNAELKQAQEQLIQSEKLSAIGQLASGVAHEINNPLSGVLGNIQIIKMEMKSGGKIEDMDELLTVIGESAQRCKSITQNLLDFSRAKKKGSEVFDIHKTIDSTVMLVGYRFKNASIEIKKVYAEGLPQSFGNMTEIQQVFLNMLKNAREAIEDKGGTGNSITIETLKLDDKFIEIKFTDTGSGMSEETQKNIFEAFFTTKEVGKGTGLGLSVCYEIMQRQDGDLTVESQKGVGTTFHIKIPVAQ